MTDRNFAERFARDWVTAWNDRDLDAVLALFADDAEFHSPRIAKVTGEAEASLKGKAAIRAYWEKALAQSANVFFEIDRVFAGAETVTILYTNHRSETVAETFIFDESRNVRLASAAYE